jgi:2-hydroxychromene-2-carboxylate isomerase
VLVDFWFDFSCPYAYLASRRIEAIATSRGASVRFRPMLLGGVFRGIGAGDGPMATLSAAKADHNLRDMARWAERLDVPFAMPPAHPMRTVRALRILLGLAEVRWPVAIHAIYAAYWQRGEDITRDDVIVAALAGAGVPADETARAVATADSEPIKADLRRRTDEAIELGVFGAPAMIVRRDEASPGTLFWGQDRLAWVDRALGGWDADADADEATAVQRWAPSAGASEPRRIDFWFDLSSPYAYLGSTQVEALAAAAGAQLTWRPFLLGALFRDLGTADVPMLAAPEAKRRHLSRDMLRWARWWGAPFRFPSRFPLRTVTALRLLLLAGDRCAPLAHRLFKAAWVEDRDLADEVTLAALCAEAGVDPALVARTREPSAREALFAATAEARAAGVFGAPTCIVHDPAGPLLFWGQDRFDLVAAAALGWRPTAG